VWCVWQR